VDVSGEDRQMFNNLPKAVAVLGNSKRLFFSHLSTMLTCLDPRLSELCYVDTDSCLWSLTYESLDDCVLPERKALWRSRAIMADEQSEQSCHGKMKLEGVYRAGLFKTSKIYRLFDETMYTRCKGVNRHQADRLENRHFDVGWNNATVVHRTCLRPRRTGEIVIATEAKKLSVPFNLKRYVTPDGIHSLPISHAPKIDDVSEDDDDDDDKWTEEEEEEQKEEEEEEQKRHEFADCRLPTDDDDDDDDDDEPVERTTGSIHNSSDDDDDDE